MTSCKWRRLSLPNSESSGPKTSLVFVILVCEQTLVGMEEDVKEKGLYAFLIFQLYVPFDISVIYGKHSTLKW